MEEDSKALTQEDVKDLLDLVEKYRKEREQKLGELPFFYNILEEVRVNENAHTRLLMHLLKHERAFTDFASWLEKEHPLKQPLSMEGRPLIDVEFNGIDGLIRERKKYAVIVENKVCGAVDQERQLGRYINECVDLGYAEDQIYILYLVDRPGKEPSEQTLEDYKEEFEGRTLVLSYTEDIIPWMQKFLDALESNKQEKEKLLRSGVVQYLDYLKMTFMNSHHIDMEEWLKEYVAGKVSSDKAELSERQIIDALTPDIDALEVLLSDAMRLRARSYIKIWEDEIEGVYKKNGGNVSVFKDLTGEALNYPKIRIPYQLNDAPFDVLVEFGVTEKKVYVGLGKHPNATKEQDSLLREKLKKGPTKNSRKVSNWSLNQYGKKAGWYGWYEVDFDEAMTKFEKLVEALKELGAKPVPAEIAEK
jgi:hypothetical protein